MITFTPTITSTPLTKGLCPIDLSKPEVYIFAGYSPTHMGLDIAGPYGTPHISPDECAVDELYIGEAGNHGMLLICPRMNALYGIRKVGIGHLDFAYDDYNTLKWYGVPISTFFENEKPKKGFIMTEPTLHGVVNRGEDLRIFMACTGNCGLVHSHIGIWTIVAN